MTIPFTISRRKTTKPFFNGCTKIINDIEQQIEKEKEKITTFYLNITNAPAVSHALSNGQLELDQENFELQMLSAYRCPYNICQFFFFTNDPDFQKQRQEGFSRLPEQYTSLKPTETTFRIQALCQNNQEKRLYGEIFMTAFEHSKPFLFYNDRGFINTLTYPAVLFPAECLRITHELIGKYFLSEDYILQYFHDKGIRFPISLAEFLSRVDIK